MKKLLPFLLVTAFAATPVLAHQAGDMILRGGPAIVMPDSSSPDVLATGELEVNNNTQLGLTLTYMATDNIGIELLAATPFSHEVSTAGLGKVAEVSHLPPTLVAQYYFGSAESRLRPYLGMGLNYTIFFDEKGKGALAGTDVSLDNSWGLAVQGGVDYSIDDSLVLNAALWWIDIDTEAQTEVGSFDTQIDPLVFMLSVGYRY